MLASVRDQAERLVQQGIHDLAGLDAVTLRRLAAEVEGQAPPGALLVVHHDRVAPSALAPLLRRGETAGFVVEDMTDVDEFAPLELLTVPDWPVYVVHDPCRHDEMLNWSPDEALPAILGAGRTPLTLVEGLLWVLQCPEVLERGRCLMTAGSRKRGPSGSLDARTPALWISNGTGRDGRGRRDAPKVGWCWAGNRHTWLGFASGATRG